MKAVKVAITAVALISASAATAENLVFFSEDVNGSVFYYDSDTIRRLSGGYMTVWTFRDASKDRTKKFRSSRVLMQIDCNGMTSGSISFVDYDANGRVLDSGSWRATMEPVVPGSVGYSLVEAVCAR